MIVTIHKKIIVFITKFHPFHKCDSTLTFDMYRASGRIVAARKMDFCILKLRCMQKQEHFLKRQDVDFLVKPRDVQKSQK